MFRDFQFLKVPEKRPFVMRPAPPKTEEEQLLDLVFACVGENSFPTGDIACYLNDDISDEVRLFIERKLFLVNTPVGSSSDLDDDVLVEMMRKRGESLDAYKERLYSFIEQTKEN